MLTYEQTKAMEDAFGTDKAAPLIAVLQDLAKSIDDQKAAVKADLLMELATKADIARLEGAIISLEQATKADIARLEGATKADIARLEGATKTELARLEGAIVSLEQTTKADLANLENKIITLEGKMETAIATLHGELKSIRLWMKLIVAVAILGMTFFSPTTIKLLDLLK